MVSFVCISVHGILCLYQCAWYPFLHRIPEHVISTRVVIIHVRLSSVIAWMYKLFDNLLFIEIKLSFVYRR